MALKAEEERKHTRSWDQPARISKIKSSLEEIIATIDPKKSRGDTSDARTPDCGP